MTIPMETSAALRRRLREAGLSDTTITAAWPQWWSSEADQSYSAQSELRFSLARKLGLDARSLLDDDQQPRFLWKGTARFKRLSDEAQAQREVLESFGTALANMLITVAPSASKVATVGAEQLRTAILKSAPVVGLPDLLSVCWSFGIPIIHLRLFPWDLKRMSAMALRVGGRYAILLGRDSSYPAPIAFYVAHELGHILLGHLKENQAIVDLGEIRSGDDSDDEEREADEFALSLLTGMKRPTFAVEGSGSNAPSLANAALSASGEAQIEPGTIAMCWGYATGKWPGANAALGFIYSRKVEIWREVNKVAETQLNLEQLPDDVRSYLRSVMGLPNDAS